MKKPTKKSNALTEKGTKIRRRAKKVPYITELQFLKIVVVFSFLFSVIYYMILSDCCNKDKLMIAMPLKGNTEIFYEETEFNPRLYLNIVNWEFPPKIFRQPILSSEGTKFIIRFKNSSIVEKEISTHNINTIKKDKDGSTLKLKLKNKRNAKNLTQKISDLNMDGQEHKTWTTVTLQRRDNSSQKVDVVQNTTKEEKPRTKFKFKRKGNISQKISSLLPRKNVTGIQGKQILKNICPIISPYLKGPVRVEKHTNLTFKDLEEKFSYLQMGGRYFPPDCIARQRVAIIVPYRDRYGHLRVFLNHMHSFLRNQQLDYTIFVIELNSITRFNKGVMFNAGFIEANLRGQFDCFIFHDVDLLPENDHNLYSCWTHSPKHLSVAVSTFDYILHDPKLIGGVNAMSTEQFVLVNGYSNKFYGWGGEDDDLYYRIRQNQMVLSRYTSDIARYVMLKHKQRTPNPIRYDVMALGRARWKSEGLNSLKYTLLNTEILRICTYILIDINVNDEALMEDTITRKAKIPSRRINR